MNNLSLELLSECFQEGTDEHWRVLRIKELYQQLKKKLNGKLTIKELHLFLIKLFDERKIELARGSSIIPYTKRYGINTEMGIYVYVRLLDMSGLTNKDGSK